MSTIEALVALDLPELKREHNYLKAVHDWAIQNLGIDYAEGDRVEICSPKPSMVGNGWAAYSEALAIGQTGLAGGVSFNQHAGRWDVLLRMDRAWSVSEWSNETKRYWSGPDAECPAGFKPCGGPDGKVQAFSMPVSWIRRVRA